MGEVKLCPFVDDVNLLQTALKVLPKAKTPRTNMERSKIKYYTPVSVKFPCRVRKKQENSSISSINEKSILGNKVSQTKKKTWTINNIQIIYEEK